MSNRGAQGLSIDHDHCRAICDEIGARLRVILKRETTDIPEYLQSLLSRFADMESDLSPSIAPSIEDMVSLGRAGSPHQRIDLVRSK
jgi:hypothetical protein